jgi:Protein of unknown function (DUF3800)
MLGSSLALPPDGIYTFTRTSGAVHPLHFRGPRESAGFRVYGALNAVYVAYLDEFGHIGPFVGRSHAAYNTSPVFGLGGIVLPVERVRSFASFFYRLKCGLLAFEIERAGVPAHRWEKKGASLYTTRNVLQYGQLRRATARLLNRIEKDQGMVFYVGVEKARSPQGHDAQRLYRTVLEEAINRLDDYCDHCSSLFLTVLDEQDRKSREELIASASSNMFRDSRLVRMIEPPMQAESHLFQTLQCADWICGLVGRAGCHLVAPGEYAELSWVSKYFSQRLAHIAPISGICRATASDAEEIPAML